jgi:hypothetical protein
VTIRLGEPEARALAIHCRIQLQWAPDAVARVVTAGQALGVFTRPPMDVLVFAAVPTMEPVLPGDAFDGVTSLAAFAATVSDACDAGLDLTALPRRSPHPADLPRLDDLPPRDGWQLPITGLAGDQLPTVEEATREFEGRAQGLPPRAQEQVAEEIWARPAFGGLPMRALHAARQLGMLGNDSSRISAATNGPWKRLSTARGQVFVHAAGPAARLSLHVVR